MMSFLSTKKKKKNIIHLLTKQDKAKHKTTPQKLRKAKRQTRKTPFSRQESSSIYLSCATAKNDYNPLHRYTIPVIRSNKKFQRYGGKKKYERINLMIMMTEPCGRVFFAPFTQTEENRPGLVFQSLMHTFVTPLNVQSHVKAIVVFQVVDIPRRISLCIDHLVAQ